MSSTLDWEALKKRIKEVGMRNSNCVAIAPTATIANITGLSQCIEPTYQNLYVKSNLSGEFTVVNEYLVRDLKRLNLWDEVMISDLKYFDGSLAKIDRIPPDVRSLYATAFEIEPQWLVECAARRQKWVDQSQSLNIYMAGASGKKLDDTYKLAWLRGLKTTYYLHMLPRHTAEQSTVAVNKAAGRRNGPRRGFATAVRRASGAATIRKPFHKRRDGRDIAKAKANAQVTKSIFQKVLAGDSSMMRYWAGTQLGWCETQHHELTGKNGAPIAVNATIDLKGLNDAELKEFGGDAVGIAKAIAAKGSLTFWQYAVTQDKDVLRVGGRGERGKRDRQR